MLEQTKQQIASLRLNGFLSALEEQLREPPHHLSFEERLALLVDREVLARDNQKLANRLKHARLKQGVSIEQVNFQTTRELNKPQLHHRRFWDVSDGCRTKTLIT